MQKKLIALAVAGLVSGSAFAQATNVTMYGIVDMGYVHTSGIQSTSGINSGQLSGSRIGFKGEEALGNGMKAMFTLEYGINSDVNTGPLANRQSYVGLNGGFGTVIAGRLQSPGRMATDKYDPLVSAPVVSVVDVMNIGAKTTIRTSARLSNAAAYVSPSMGGLTLIAAYSYAGAESLAASKGDAIAYGDQERILGLQAEYVSGPLSATFVHHRANDLTNAAGVDERDSLVAASYDFGVAKAYGTYQTAKNPGNISNKVFQLGAVIPVASGSVNVSYATLNHETVNMDASGFGILYMHNLSKRTTAYAGYSRVANDPASTLRVVGNAGAAVAAGDNSSGYGFGVRHSF